MVEANQGELSISKENEFSREVIGRYVEGCAEVAVTLHTVVDNIRAAGKKPIILIPSRGAVPIFLLANEALKFLDKDHFLINPQQVGYYPRRIFQVLSQERVGEAIKNSETTVADVILYPFTADVSEEQDGVEEWLARELRISCSRALYDLVFKTNQYQEDLDWYYFLMSKLRKDPHVDQGLNPDAIVEELKSYPGTEIENSQLVLIDTVISGRAAENIVTAFRSLGHTVVPILAVDAKDPSSMGHFQKQRRAEIERSIAWEYMGEETPFIPFPLITEDKGAALLGVSAINFATFNKPGFFRRVDKRFKSDFLPQSCIWTLPPGSLLKGHLDTFHKFLGICLEVANNKEPEKLLEFQASLLPLISKHGEVDIKDIKALVEAENGTNAKESSSHIISVTLPEKQALEWIKSFATGLFQKNT